QALDVKGNINVEAGPGSNGYIKVAAAGCSAAITVTTGNNICGGTQYATFTPGIYIEGWSYQSQGVPNRYLSGGPAPVASAVVSCCNR
ncbi:MAG: hypothetical protein NUW21_07645, partial [Elusimicrobia bacterium]|nr:hypothetical protein [Elusimicrobiota bacterium]